MAGTVLLLGTFDTKGHEYAFVCDRLRELDVAVLLVDAGINEPVGVEPDVARGEVAAAGGRGPRGAGGGRRPRRGGGRDGARRAGGRAAALRRRVALTGFSALGGSGGSSIATAAMRALPVGVPKLMVSTMASGDTRPYVGATDIAMMYSVVDIAGVNRRSRRGSSPTRPAAIAGHGERPVQRTSHAATRR